MQVTTVEWSPATGWSGDLPVLPASAGGRTLVLVFFDPSLAEDPTPLHELTAALPGAAIAGCSTAGQILDGWAAEAVAVAVVMTFDSVTASVVRADVEEAGSSTDLGALLGRRAAPLLAPGQPGVVFVLADGTLLNGSGLVDGLAATLPPGATVSGGLAGDGERFGSTWVLVDGGLRGRTAAAVVLTGPRLRALYAIAGGWDGFGPYRAVTRSQGNTLFELDGRPALELYAEYLGDRAAGLPASALLFPLELRSPDGDVRVVRTILTVDPATSSMTFAGDVPQGWTARLMRTSLDRLVDAVDTATAETLQRGWPDVVLAVSCVGRRLVLGERTDEEVEVVRDVVGTDTPVVGFFSYGEISPVGTCSVHNQTMTLTALREDPP